LIIASLASLFRALTLDFSKYFPARLNVDVYFDEKGIERHINVFSSIERAEVSLTDDWKQHVVAYDEAVKSSLGKLWREHNLQNMPDMSDFIRDLVNAGGMVSFEVRRVGWLSYCITKSEGHLDFNLDVPKKSRRSFHTTFVLRKTAANHINPKFLNLLKSPYVILRPEFKQIFSTERGRDSATFDHIVIGWTKIYLLPFPHLTDTIYLWKLPNGKTVPIGYAINTPDVPALT
jgi:hypothetical protein